MKARARGNARFAAPARNAQPEYHLSCAVRERLKALRQLGLLRGIAFHVENEGNKTDKRKILAWRMGVVSGVFDWAFLWDTGCGMIELKAGKNELEDSQELFAAWMDKEGVQHALCRSVAEVEAVLKGWGILRG